MGENYAGSQYIAYTTKIRAVLKELPELCGRFFPRHRKRYAGAYKIRLCGGYADILQISGAAAGVFR